jgi:hypothetical protein
VWAGRTEADKSVIARLVNPIRRKRTRLSRENRAGHCSHSWTIIWASWRIITAAAITSPRRSNTWGRAGVRAAQQVAHSEAIGYFTRALELLRRLPAGAGRDSQELDLQMALSWSSFVARGPRAPRRESTLVRARELCEQFGGEFQADGGAPGPSPHSHLA